LQAPVITFLSDYGLVDPFVGVCHGVIATICPQARVIDLTHGIARHDVRAGAITLADAMAYLPPGIHLAVVDPDVGGRRRAVALALGDGRRLVGPDNGLLSLAAAAGGGVDAAVEISGSPLRLEPVSATFHGRDIFAPVAAHLAAGVALADAGDALDPSVLVALELPAPRWSSDGTLTVHVRQVDRFGNVQLDGGAAEIAAGIAAGRPAIGGAPLLQLPGGRAEPVRHVVTFADVGPGELLLYLDADRRLAIAVSHGDAAARLGLAAGDELRILPA
jgi:S-adenosylmethionine hydrolase